MAAWKKIELLLEVIGMAVALTLTQIVVTYIMFSDFLAKKYISFYDTYLYALELLYGLVIAVLSKIFGGSYLVALFRVYERLFFLIFLVNLFYFALSRRMNK